MDWHEIAIWCGGSLFAVGGYVWVRTVAQLDRIESRLTEHIESDRVEFGKVYERVFQQARDNDNERRYGREH